jgi:hypothetical protein
LLIAAKPVVATPVSSKDAPPTLRAEAPIFQPSPVKPGDHGFIPKMTYIRPEDKYRANNQAIPNNVYYPDYENRKTKKTHGGTNSGSSSSSAPKKMTWEEKIALLTRSKPSPSSSPSQITLIKREVPNQVQPRTPVAIPQSFDRPQQKKR